MDSVGHHGRSRPSRGRRPEAWLAERRPNRESPLPSPVWIRRCTRVVARDAGGARLKSWTPVVALTRARSALCGNQTPPATR